MNTELLRPFDLEAAKAGDLLTDPHSNYLWSYVAGPDAIGKHILGVESDQSKGVFTCPCKAENLRMAPLCWCEGRPVYKGDVLYGAYGENVVKAANSLPGWLLSEAGIDFQVEGCTWTKPKIKKSGWMNRYPTSGFGGALYETKARADLNALSNRTDCIEVHWEE